jgi:hypothetical protein
MIDSAKPAMMDTRILLGLTSTIISRQMASVTATQDLWGLNTSNLTELAERLRS